jgi:hypothetical protein
MDVSDLFWNASQAELKNGCIEVEDCYICLLCGKKIEKGIVYPDENILYEAGRYIRVHIEKTHGSVFTYLMQLDKKFTGLTDHQNNLLRLFYQGKSDEEVKKTMDIGSTATIRNHRFVLKEKERQARVFLTMMELLKEKDSHAPAFLNFHKTAKLVDDRYNVTQDEKEKILKKYFPQGVEGQITTFSLKEKERLVVLQNIAQRFQSGLTYSEAEVNQLLKPVYDDYVTIRRYLIEYGFLDRKPDGSQYWLKE